MRGHPAASLVIALLLLAAPALAQSATLKATSEASRSGPTPHPSILVVGDGNFTAPGSGVVSGSGTAADPYVIEGWAIVHTRASAIRLVDTTKHVVIRDVYLEGQESEAADVVDCVAPPAWCDGSQGVTLLNASNVRVENVRVVGETIGIHALSSRGVHVADVVVTVDAPTAFAPVIALQVRGSEDVTIVNATLRTVQSNVLSIQESRNVTVTDSRFVGDAGRRVGVGFSDGVTFARNRFEGAVVNVERIGRISFLDNDFTGGDRGISWTRFGSDFVHDVVLCGNRFGGYSGYAGVLLEGVGNLTAVGNSFEGGVRGVRAIAQGSLVFERNLVANASDIGAYLQATGAQVHWNAFEGNARGVSIPSPLSNATENWWGHATGPSGSGRAGLGDRLANGTHAIPYEPFLAGRPDLDVDCGAPVVGTPQARAPFAVEANAEAKVHVKAKLDVLGIPVRVNETRTIPLGTGPILLP